MTSLHIFLFGNFELSIDGKKISGDLWQSRQLRTILKLLIIRRGQPVPGSQLIDKIWPDKDPDLAAQHLYVRMSQMRKILKKFGVQDLIHTVEGGYILNTERPNQDHLECKVWIDVDAFENAAGEAREHLEKSAFDQAIILFKKAIGYYRADFLIDDLYEDWAIGERERLRDRYLMVLTELAESYARTGRYRHAIDVGHKVLSIDPCRESTFVQIMFYYYHLGERTKALEVFERCEETLSQEMAVTPDAYTRQLADKIRVGDVGTLNGGSKYPIAVYTGRLFEVPYSLSETPFVGRDVEFSWLIQELKQPEPAIIWVNGESGVGKTRLLEEICRFINAKQTQVVILDASTVTGTPYAVWLSLMGKYHFLLNTDGMNLETQKIINSLLGLDKEPLDLFSKSADQGVRNLVQKAILGIFEHKLSPHSVIWIDNAHLMDKVSLFFLEELAKKFFILLSSTDEAEQSTQHFSEFTLKHIKKIKRLSIQRWRLSQTQAFLKKLSGCSVPELSERLQAISGGNPFFLVNALQHLFEEGILFISSENCWSQTAPINIEDSKTLEDLISARLHKNTIDEQRVLDAIAVAGGDTDYEILQDVLNINESNLMNLTDNLIQRGLLMEPRKISEAELSFSHFIYKDVIYRSLPKPRLKRYHKQVGNAMLRKGYSTNQYTVKLAHHFEKGEDFVLAARYSMIAGDYLRSLYAPQEAISYYKTAIEWLSAENDSVSLAMCHFGMAEALRLVGKSVEALQHYEFALPSLKGEIRQAAIYLIFQLKVLQGKPLGSYHAIAEEAQQAIADEGISWALPLLFWSHSFVYLLIGDQKMMHLYNARGWRVARQLIADDKKPATWICNRAFSLMMRAHNQWGNYHTSIHFAKKNMSLLPSNTQDVNIKEVIEASLGESYYHLGEYDRARQAFQLCYKLASKAGDLRLQGESLIGLGSIAFEHGDFEDCQKKIKQVLSLVQQKLDILRYIQATFLQAKMAIAKKEVEGQAQTLTNILSTARYQGANPYIAKSLILLAEVHLVEGSVVEAENAAKEALDITMLCDLKREFCQANRAFGLSLHHQGNRKAAREHLRESVIMAEEIGVPFEKGLSLRTKALLEPEPSLELLEESLAIFDKIGARFESQNTRDLILSLQAEYGNQIK